MKRIPAKDRHQWHSLSKLRLHVQHELPLVVRVSSASMETDCVVYNCTVSSATTKRTWTISYRYSKFVDFRAKLEDLWTCHDANCAGSCQALRDIVSIYFPKKRLRIISTRTGTITSRKSKFELVLTHLLRSVLLPGSAMKCLQARQNLPINLFDFLGVKNDSDRRSLLQIFVDNSQVVVSKSNPSLHPPNTTSVGCMICLCDVDLQHGHQQCDNSLIVLRCEHAFHRQCIFQRLLFETYCPVCRMRVCPNAVTNYCRPNHQAQWWLSDFDEDILHAPAG
ncbi:uncharacterized protein KRP23_9642 [Phytophthora ramorum]|uniref:uncharacterized protein n=1 Tax=Phytophthora ramorum TaxID=164328 RepID=UPI003097A4B0|nr:hypothetical protein KRP23_9642 [Phytophthora ramorum]